MTAEIIQFRPRSSRPTPPEFEALSWAILNAQADPIKEPEDRYQAPDKDSA